MNLLPIVIGLLLLMSALTYNQMNSFLIRSVLRIEATCAMQGNMLENVNRKQKELFDEAHVKSNKDESKNTQKIDAIKLINLDLFADPKNEIEIHKTLFKRLLVNLYQNRLFFQEALQNRPDLVDELTERLIEKLSNEKLGKNKKKLANLEFNDEVLDITFAKMLSYVQTAESFAAECDKKKATSFKTRYYPTILDFVTLKGTQDKPYRVWLMPKELLFAVYQDKTLVKEIIDTRKRLHKEIKAADKDIRPRIIEESSDEFRIKYQNYLPFDMQQKFFNFEASNTYPGG